jgi:RNA polymerase sigma-70 factor (ECF subfamily)
MIFKSGKQDVVRALVDEMPYLRRFARGLVSDRALADDLVQDTIERALTRLHLFDRNLSLRNWLFRILRNLCVNHYRAVQRRGEHVEFDELAITDSVGLQAQEAQMQLNDVSAGLRQLSHEQREVLLLVSLEGLSYREAAEVLSLPIGTVMSRLGRARTHLREFMGEATDQRIRRVK